MGSSQFYVIFTGNGIIPENPVHEIAPPWVLAHVLLIEYTKIIDYSTSFAENWCGRTT